VGMEATGHARWFERLLAELGFELWIGDPAEIKTKRVRKQKTDREDARLLLKLLLENRFPRIGTPCPENRDLRQLLWHRHRLVQMRTRIMLKRENVDVLFGEGLAELAKCSRLSSKRIVNSLAVGMVGTSLRCTSWMGWKGPARSNDVSNPTPCETGASRCRVLGRNPKTTVRG
jgi:transposase